MPNNIGTKGGVVRFKRSGGLNCYENFIYAKHTSLKRDLNMTIVFRKDTFKSLVSLMNIGKTGNPDTDNICSCRTYVVPFIVLWLNWSLCSYSGCDLLMP